jgi:hypothetical protein
MVMAGREWGCGGIVRSHSDRREKGMLIGLRAGFNARRKSGDDPRD